MTDRCHEFGFHRIQFLEVGHIAHDAHTSDLAAIHGDGGSGCEIGAFIRQHQLGGLKFGGRSLQQSQQGF